MSTAAIGISQTDVLSRPAELSLFRLYTLRVAYLIMAGGLGVFVWPSVIHHTNQLAIAHGAELAMLAGLGAVARAGASVSRADAAGVDVRGGLEGDLSDSVCVSRVVCTPGHSGDGGRHQGRFD